MEKQQKICFPFSEKDTTVISTSWTEGNRHEETGSQHNDVVLAFICKSSPTFRLINKSHTTGDVKACPRLVQPRVTTLREDANIRRWHRRNISLTVSTSARRTYWTQCYVPSHWLSNKLGKACLFLKVLFLVSFSGDPLM